MADTNTTTRIIEIRTNYADAIQSISEYMKKLDEAKEAEKELKKAIKESGEATDEDREQLAALKQVQTECKQGINALNKEIQNNIKAEQNNGDSINALRAQLTAVTKEYDNLSAAERNGAQGTAMRDHLNELTTEIKKCEEETQRFQRNVGNYTNSIQAALSQGNPFISQIIKMTGGATTASGAFENTTTSVKGFGKQLLALLANPIVAILAAIAAAVMAVSKAIKSSEELTNRWNAVIAPLQRALQGLMKVLQTLAGGIISVVEGAEKLMTKTMDWLSGSSKVGKAIKEINDANKEAIALATEKADIEKTARENEVQNAEDNARIAQLRSEAQDKEKYTAEERLAMLQEANDLAGAELQRNKELAERKLAALEEESKWNQNSKELNDKIAEARVEAARAEEEYYTGTRRLQTQMRTTQKEIQGEATAAAEEQARIAQEAAEAREKQRQEELADIRKTTDMRIAAIKDRYERELAEENESFSRNLEELQNRLATEATLTETQRAALNEQIELMTQAHEDKLTEISAQQAAERVTQMQQQEQKTLQLRLAVVEQGSAEELEIRKEILTAQMEQQIESEEYTEEQIALLKESYNMQFAALDAAYYAQQQQDAKKNADELKKIEQDRLNATKSVYSGMTQLVKAFGEDNEEAAKAAKVLAVGQIAIDTGLSIAQAVEKSIEMGWPACIPVLATLLGTILANMATAVSTVKSASFSTGGYVSGAGTSKSDSINARLSNGESVNTALATSMFAPLYSVLNQIGGGVAYTGGGGNEEMGEALLTRAFAKGAALIQPVVSVKEINDVGARVKVLESLGRV